MSTTNRTSNVHAPDMGTGPTQSRLTPAERTSRGRLAAQTRHHPEAELTKALAAKYAADGLARHIAKVVAQATPLSEEQKTRLALLLHQAT